jgi:hypothetical protein
LNGVNAGRYPKIDFNLEGAKEWANRKGTAIQLSLSNEMRVRVIEEALKLAEREVPYDLTHVQADVTELGQWMERRGMRSLKLDCIAMCSYVYEKAVGLDIDVSWKPWHTPTQLYDHFHGTLTAAQTDFRPVQTDAAFLGLWKVVDQSYSSSGMSDDEVYAAKDALWLPSDTTFQVRRLGSKLEFELIEISPTKQQEPLTLKHVANRVDAAPYGFASTSQSAGGAAVEMYFIPLDESRAQLQLRMVTGSKRMTIRVKLERKRFAP